MTIYNERGKKLNFLGRKADAANILGNKGEVFVRINSKGKQACFSFRNGCEQKITKTGYIKMACDGGRIYFIESTLENRGLKCSGESKNQQIVTTTIDEFMLWALKNPGEYSLKKDKTAELYYIEKEV